MEEPQDVDFSAFLPFLNFTMTSLTPEATSDLGGSMFREASDIHIHGGRFNAYGSGGPDGKKKMEKAMVRLSLRAEQGAPYDAAAREDVPKCHEHTRVVIINGVHKWAHSQEADARTLMWIYGPASKTFDEEGTLAASFFFSRLSAERQVKKDKFVSTIALQLSRSIPALQQPLADALLDSSRSMLNKSFAKRMDALVIDPLNMIDPAEIGARRIFLVDGLDECDGDTAQQDILNLLEQFSKLARPCGILEIKKTSSLTDEYQSDMDVKLFVILQFAKIRRDHPARNGLPLVWPSWSDIDILVRRASGQFIYASVVMKFIGTHARHLVESLQAIISLQVDGNVHPYDELDALYAQVLSTIEPENVEFVRTLMGCLLLDKTKFYFARISQTDATKVLDLLFMIQPGATDARLNRMSPLITTTSEGMKFTHASFPEYLLDRSKGPKSSFLICARFTAP
ncbi:hypothetical protein D9619_013680 [Psilocybe cf. subviscida]|uniref:Nephrocystin 3-like N-terminal domain-containing protein n=1 Tax=Psilocybe cf. subviscida TaxID=2480587 RepID=A0A8H5AZI1_9AGAR|nr:hypothetical protein D9619_013680 [Psilocybe cf. subviscida]